MSHLAERLVERSNGEKVKLVLGKVDRPAGRVTITIPIYNTAFVFQRGARNFAILTADGRQVIDSEKPAIEHVSRSVYQTMAQWAWSILIAER